MVMQSLRNGAAGGFLKYILFGLLGMAMGGLVLMDSRGVMDGGVGSRDVAKIEGEVISLRDFDRSLRLQLTQYNRNITVQDAHSMGLTSEVLAREIRNRFLNIDARNTGIQISNDLAAQKVAEIVKPQMREGETMQQTLELMLRLRGLSEKQFIEAVKRESAAEVLTESIRMGFVPSTDALAEELYAFQTQKRDIRIVVFKDKDVKDVPAATEEQLTKLYEATKRAQYRIPEYRKAQMALFNPNALQVYVTVSDAEIRKAYDDNPDIFAIGEQLVLTQAIVDSPEKASEIHKLVSEGKDLKAASILVAGKDVRFIEDVPFAETAMLPAIDKALEDREVGSVSKPIKTTLGHHIVKLMRIIPPSIKPFNDVKDSILSELSQDKKGELLYERTTIFEDMLTNGDSFEDIAKEINIEISELSPIDQFGRNKDGINGLNGFAEADSFLVAETIFEVTDGETSLMQELADGRVVAFKVIDTEDETFKSFESVKADIAKTFIEDQRRAENSVRMNKYLAELSTGGSTLESIAKSSNKLIKTIEKIGLEGEMLAPLSDSMRPQIFQTDLYGHDVLELDDGFALMQVSGYDLSDTKNKTEMVSKLNQKIVKESKDESVLVYLNYLADKYSAEVNEKLLNQTYAPQASEGE